MWSLRQHIREQHSQKKNVRKVSRKVIDNNAASDVQAESAETEQVVKAIGEIVLPVVFSSADDQTIEPVETTPRISSDHAYATASDHSYGLAVAATSEPREVAETEVDPLAQTGERSKPQESPPEKTRFQEDSLVQAEPSTAERESPTKSSPEKPTRSSSRKSTPSKSPAKPSSSSVRALPSSKQADKRIDHLYSAQSLSRRERALLAVRREQQIQMKKNDHLYSTPSSPTSPTDEEIKVSSLS